MSREKNPVEIFNGLDFREKDLVITQGVAGFSLMLGVADGSGYVTIAACSSADKIGRWALDRGARQVRHSYDLTSKAGMK